ncbi:T9SS type B sorting domain-containing protein [Spongiivirga sp. MCCC 1A20706]|uniref:T9SS type B sorting domain-containing protein n=1 Tax=Spongiivirga sp. MCCC 1A20706 TaxID=3160963 RepID=UPI0039775E70
MTYSVFGQAPNDCVNAIVVCGSGTINSNADGVGTQELNGTNTCSSQENNSLWLRVNVIADGNLGFILTPTSNDIVIDYDFFIYGPNATCGNLGQAIRCSTTNPQAAGQGDNRTGMIEGLPDTSEGPGQDGDSFVNWLDVQAGESYFIVIDRPIGQSPFELEWVGSATNGDVNELAEPPRIENPGDQEICTRTSPTSFDLSTLNATILDGQTNLNLTYHESIADATEGINPIVSNYSFSGPSQQIYARVQENSGDCFNVTDFQLRIANPPIEQPDILRICDDNFDAIVTTDLSQVNSTVLGTLLDTDYTITYHASLENAENDIDRLSTNYTNTSAIETIFIRLQENGNPDCFSTTSFDIEVNTPPEILSGNTLEQCDNDNDGIGNFNLNQAYDLVAVGTNYTLSFYETNADASLARNAIDANAPYQNNTLGQEIFVVVTTPENCSSVTNLFINAVGANLGAISPMISCEDSDGVPLDNNATFDLSEKKNQIRTNFGLAANISLAFYPTLADAEFEQNELPDDLITQQTTVWVRAEGGMQNCQGIEAVALIVNELPDPILQETYQVCLNSLPDDPLVVNGGIFEAYEWRQDGSPTVLGTNQTFSIDSGGTYSLTVFETQNGVQCQKTETFQVNESNIASFTNIEINDGTTNNTVIVTVSGEGIYEYALDTPNGPYQDSNAFNNVSAGFHDVFVRDKNGCGTVDQQISVIGFPKFFTPNGDGYNDTWQMLGVNEQFQPNSVIYIYNRMGKLLKQMSPLATGWDGTFNGQFLPASDYWFSITLEDGRNLKGHFSLKR